MFTLVRQNPAIRTLPRWLAISAVLATVHVNYMTFLAWRQQEATSPLGVAAVVWLAVTVYLVFGEVRTRCSPFAMALPISARRVWLSHLTAVVLSGVAVLAVVASFVASGVWLLWKVTGRWSVSVEEMGGLAVHVGAGLILAVALLQRPLPAAHRVRRTAESVLLTFFVMVTILVLVVVLNGVSPWTALITLALAVTVGLYHYRLVPEVFKLETVGAAATDPVGRDAVREQWGAIGAGRRPAGAAFFRFLNITIWRCFQVDVKLKRSPWISLPFVLLFGAFLSGLDARWLDESMRFSFVWITVYMLIALSVHYPKQLYLVDGLPVSRRRVLGVMVVPYFLVTVLGYGVGRVTMEYLERERPKALEVIQLKEDRDANYYLYVPYNAMRISWDGRIPDTVAPWGETHEAWSRPLFHGSRVKLYTPYHTPPGSSPDYVAWQMSRAVEAVYGESISQKELRERYLEARDDGGVALKTDRLTIDADYPYLERIRTAGPAFPVVMALTFSLWMFALAVYFQAFRAGIPNRRRMAVTFVLLAVTMLGWLAVALGPILRILNTPVINAFLTIVLRRAGESAAATTGIWVVSVALSLASYRLALWRLERAEAIQERKAAEVG